jgi:hypothetical protein
MLAHERERINNNYILDVFQARDGTIYVGTFGGGLNIVKDPKNPLDFLHITSEDGLPSNTIYQIKEDDAGQIWMLHVREISMWNPTTKVLKYYQSQDGFSVTEFKDNAMIITKSGMIIAGGSNGFTFMNSNEISVNKTPPQLQITDLRLFDKSVKPLQEIDGQVVLNKTINNTFPLDAEAIAKEGSVFDLLPLIELAILASCACENKALFIKDILKGLGVDDSVKYNNNLPKMSVTKFIHLRPHGKNSFDFDKSYLEHRGVEISKQSYWLNKTYINTLLSNYRWKTNSRVE